MKKIIFATVAVLGVLAFFWRDILFFIIVTFVRPDYQISPNQEISWQEGPEVRTDDRPNIIVIVADDLGINDMTNYDDLEPGGTVNTPNIDFIANSGIKFKNAYSGSATCAPSRGMIVTGRYATTTGFEFTPVPVGMARAIALFSDGAAEYIPENDNTPFELAGLSLIHI